MRGEQVSCFILDSNLTPGESDERDCAEEQALWGRVSQKTLFLNFASFFESLVRMGVQRPQKKFQRYRPINDT